MLFLLFLSLLFLFFFVVIVFAFYLRCHNNRDFGIVAEKSVFSVSTRNEAGLVAVESAGKTSNKKETSLFF